MPDATPKRSLTELLYRAHEDGHAEDLAMAASGSLDALHAFGVDAVTVDDAGRPGQLAKAHGFELAEGKTAGTRGGAPVYFLHDADANANPSVRAVVVTYPGRRAGTVRRGVLFTFVNEAS